jgi:hypothetical protein
VLTTSAERHTLVNPTTDRCLLHVNTHTGQPLCDAEPLATFATTSECPQAKTCLTTQPVKQIAPSKASYVPMFCRCRGAICRLYHALSSASLLHLHCASATHVIPVQCD